MSSSLIESLNYILYLIKNLEWQEGLSMDYIFLLKEWLVFYEIRSLELGHDEIKSIFNQVTCNKKIYHLL